MISPRNFFPLFQAFSELNWIPLIKPKTESALSIMGVWKGLNTVLEVLSQALQTQMLGGPNSGQFLEDNPEPAPWGMRGVGSRKQLFPAGRPSPLRVSLLTHPGQGGPFSAQGSRVSGLPEEMRVFHAETLGLKGFGAAASGGFLYCCCHETP